MDWLEFLFLGVYHCINGIYRDIVHCVSNGYTVDGLITQKHKTQKRA
jgi:hypothetical protein